MLTLTLIRGAVERHFHPNFMLSAPTGKGALLFAFQQAAFEQQHVEGGHLRRQGRMPGRFTVHTRLWLLVLDSRHGTRG